MKFLYPYFLFALLAVAIPLVIHFFNFKRYKTIYFSNVNFLKAVKKDSHKKTQIKQILILSFRILAISSLVFTFSQPYQPLTDREMQSGRQAVAIYIDNSFSMRLEGEKGILLEQARNKAVEIAASYRPGTRFLLLTNDFLPQHRYFLDKEQLTLQLGELKVSPNAAGFEPIVNFARQQLATTGKRYDKTLYVLSDFQKNNYDFSSLQSDTTMWTFLMPFTPGKINNLFIDSCWFDLPGRKINQAEKLFVRVVNSSGEDYQNIPLRLQINDSLKAISNMNIGAGEEQVVEMAFTNNTAGFQYGMVELDDYPLVYDNSYFFAFDVKRKVDVLGIFEEGDRAAAYFRALFSGDDFVNYNEAGANSIQVSQIRDAQCVFLVNLESVSSGLLNELVRFVENGGALAVFPAGNADPTSYNQFFSAFQANTISGKDTAAMYLSEINYNDILFRNVFTKKENRPDLPALKNTFGFTKKSGVPETVLMAFRNGQPAMSVRTFGNGKLYSFAFPADLKNSSFLKHVIFVPSVYNVAINSLSGQPVSYLIELQNLLLLSHSRLSGAIGQLVFQKRDTKDEFLPTVKPLGDRALQIDIGGFVRAAGHYNLLNNSQIIEAVAYNYKRNESTPEFYAAEEIRTLISERNLEQFMLIDDTGQNFQETLSGLNNGKQLWPYFLALMFLFILLESLVIRLLK